MVSTIKEGFPIFIYPEGTRNRTTEPLKSFYDGAFRLAIEAKVPIVAQTILGVKEIYNADTPLFLQPGRVDVYFDWIDTSAYASNEAAKLREDVKEIMLERIRQHSFTA
jgi:1-acyl-sn-glycerol-3-phosphate acyltransferase